MKTTRKKAFQLVLSALVALALALYLFRDTLRETGYDWLTRDMFIAADTDQFDPGPAVGSHFPGLRARYQGRTINLLDPFAGPRGTLFIASRSVEWCPYCMRQLIQLQSYQPEFAAAGIGMVAVTYDSPEQQRLFADRFGITIPMLSDIDALSFKTLGILNKDYDPGDDHYGIPYPGMIVVDPDGIVVGKLFIEGYSSRVDSAAALAFARQVLGID